MLKNQKLVGVAIQLMAVMFAGLTASNHVFAANTHHSVPATELTQEVPIREMEVPKDSVMWENDTLSIAEATVVSHFGSSKKSPLRLTTIDDETLKQRAVAKSYPEMLRNIPGLYATAESGSFGDARVNIRGFKQENISILLNGIPISGQTSGNMYWNNWMGLADATYAIQVQKGPGTSMLSDNSVGGTINILTTPATEDFYIDMGAYATHWGSGKGYLSINSGRLPKGWSINFMASYLGGKGYVNQTDVSAFTYMLNVHKTLGLHHSLTFTALGSPEKHGQRSTKLSYKDITEKGLKVNKNWGMLNGEPYNLSRNNYFKPYFTLQHRFSKGKWSMQNSIYLAIAHGGGRWNEMQGGRMTNIMDSDGRIDFERILRENAERAESGKTGAEGSAKYILSDFMAGHTQVGAIMSGAVQISHTWRLEAGAHYQHYSTWENESITDLLGGNYWWETTNKSDAGSASYEKKVGDAIRTDNGKVTDHYSLYAQASFDQPHWHVNLGISGIGVTTRRWDRYNYSVEEGIWSKNASGWGFSSKAGVLFSPVTAHSIYANAAIYSRVPYPNAWFSSGNNEITADVSNEWNYLAELGYRFTWQRGGLELTGYYSFWQNKTLMSNKYKPADGEDRRFMIKGLDARHYGAEFEVYHRFARWIKLSAFASIGDWTWCNDVQAQIYDEYSGQVVDNLNVYTAGLHVGDAPQTQIGAAADFNFLKDFHFQLDWAFNDRMYADFDPASRTNPEDRSESYHIPGYHLLNAHLDWTHTFRERFRLTIFAKGNNLLNTLYIERGKDGANHDLESFRGFWGFGRNFAFGARFRF